MDWLAPALTLPMIVIVSAYLWGVRRVALVAGVLLLLVCVALIPVVLNSSVPYIVD
jgi:hypothetical protein